MANVMRRGAAISVAILLAIIVRSAAAAPADTRAAFLKMIDRPRVEPAVKEKQSEADGLTRIDFSFASESGQRVPSILLKKPGAGRRAIVIVLHGTGGNKEKELPYAKQLVAREFIAVTIDGRF